MNAPSRRTVLAGLVAASLSLLVGCSNSEIVVGRDATSRSKRNIKGAEEPKNQRPRPRQGG